MDKEEIDVLINGSYYLEGGSKDANGHHDIQITIVCYYCIGFVAGDIGLQGQFAHRGR